MKSTLCLNMIVKNEKENLRRCFDAVCPYISCYVIVDTGSTDGTPEFIKAYWEAYDIPGEVHHVPFKNFSQARNEALACAHASQLSYDYLLLTDADMELVVEDPEVFEGLTAPAYHLMQNQFGLVYANVRLLRRNAAATYCSPTHEYLSVEGAQELNRVFFKDWASGANRPDKPERDLALLTTAVTENPKDVRAWFYLGQTHHEAGRFMDAIRCYETRVELGGWEEEIWYAKRKMAHCWKELGSEAKFVSGLLDAYNYRPIRAETLCDLARFYREKPDQQTLAYMFASEGAKLPIPNDLLFVESGVYKFGLLQELMVAGFYLPQHKDEAFSACDKLIMSKDVDEGAREHAKQTMFHYLEPLVNFAPSFTPYPIKFPTENLWSVTNPCVTSYNGDLVANLRLVNYKIRPDGSYDLQGDPSVRTKNVLVSFTEDMNIWKSVSVRPPALPYKNDRIVGWEDIRLLPSPAGILHVNATVLDQNADGWAEQFHGILQDDGEIINVSRMPTPGGGHNYEKNWCPIVMDRKVRYVYRQGLIVDHHGEVVTAPVMMRRFDELSGGSQAIPFDGGWLMLVHSSRPHPNTGKRVYSHRFVWLDHTAAPTLTTRPFVFYSRDIEFALGLCRHPWSNKLVISFGCNDHTAHLATVDPNEIRSMLR